MNIDTLHVGYSLVWGDLETCMFGPDTLVNSSLPSQQAIDMFSVRYDMKYSS